jgi:hypothetical protein
MTDPDDAVYVLLDQAAGGAVGGAPVDAILAAGRRRRHDRRALQVGAAVVAVALVVAGALTVAGHTGAATKQPGAPVTVKPVPGPTAQQLAAGRWVKMPAAPVHLCNPQAVWDGRDLVVFEGPFNKCPAVAATYDPRANTWTKIAPPPASVGTDPAAAWGGGRLVLVSPATGFAAAWSPVTGRWARLDNLPAPGASSLVWTGRTMIAVTAHVYVALHSNHSPPAQSFELFGNSWKALPALPQPDVGVVYSTGAVVASGTVYVLEGISNNHINAEGDGSYSGSVELLRLVGGHWSDVPVPQGFPQSELGLTQIGRGAVAVGSDCQGGLEVCTEEFDSAALIRPGEKPLVVPLTVPHNVPNLSDVTAGGNAVVVTYPAGAGSFNVIRPSGSGPVVGYTQVYDAGASRWLHGPLAPKVNSRAAGNSDLAWTPYGVVAVDRHGWLLRPAS